MMHRLLKVTLGAFGLVAAAGAIAMPASAQGVGGMYAVAGKNIDGSAYTGIAQINLNASTCSTSWQNGGTSSEGLCMLSNKTLAAFYELGSTFGMVIYDLQPNGSLQGNWAIVDRPGRGTEMLTPAR